MPSASRRALSEDRINPPMSTRRPNSPWPRGPWGQAEDNPCDLPGSAQEVSVRAWGLRPRGARTHLAMSMCTILPSGQSQGVGAPYKALSRLDTQPAPAPVNACHNPSRGNSHDSGASVVRYSFTARDLHPQLLAGLSRRFGFQPLALGQPLTWGFAPGWYGIGPLALQNHFEGEHSDTA